MTKTHPSVIWYKELSLVNLLYLQAETHQLKAELDKETASDAMEKRDRGKRYWDYHWFILATSAHRGVGKRWQIWLRLRERLYEYCARDASLPPPMPRCLSCEKIVLMMSCSGRFEDGAIEKHNRIAKLASPADEQRKNMSEYITDDDLNGARYWFLSAELEDAQGETPA